MNKILNKLKEGFPEYKFELQVQTKEYARAFISLDDIQIGRVNFKNNKITHLKHYKPANYEYEKEDDIFYLYELWLEKNKRINLENLAKIAKKIRQNKTDKILKWRQENPRVNSKGERKSRPRIETNWMGEFRGLVYEEINKLLNE